MHAVRMAVGALIVGAAFSSATSLAAQPAVRSPLPLKRAPEPTTAAITVPDLQTRLYQFADDSMAGRASGTEGHLKATAYIASEMQRLGLKPAGMQGTFFQDIPLVSRGFATGGGITVRGRRFRLGDDFGAVVARDATVSLPAHAIVVLGGELGDATSYPRAKQLKGRVVVLRPSSRRLSMNPRSLAVSHDSPLAGAAAVVVPLWEQLSPSVRRQLSTMAMAMRTGATTLPPVLLVSAAMGEALTASAGSSVALDLQFREDPASARNVVALLPGSDPVLRAQYVALGAHSDHDPALTRALDHDSVRAMSAARRALIASMPAGRRPTSEQLAALRVDMDSLRAAAPPRADSIRNGADDDGSGAVAVLEIAEWMASGASRPRRSVLFVWHAAEELGLYGADWFTDHPTVDRDAIVAHLNLDMVGRGGVGDIPGGGPRYVQLIGARRISPQLGDLIVRVNSKRETPFEFDYSLDADGHPENIYCRSDHAKYARFGIPVAFFSTGLHLDYHQVTDEPQYIEYEKLAELTRFISDVTVTIANAPTRLRVPGRKFDPSAPCRQ